MSEIQGLNLSNVCEGKLDRQFKAKYPEIISNLREGQKATITVSLTIERPAGSTMMTSITGKVTTKMPPGAAVAGLYAFNNDYQIKTEEPVQQGVIQFPASGN
ncbi:hypothetical protein SOV_51200 [Sporomusa ovata DSM 2662]|uniref:Uncharacterized protein n=1 Tax=Sporomusa ovata TaxID=2378 RepID=A0A0U1L0Y4_9FIRM|nr:hypothetical protein [Sporomusa ovata]EQB27493.1 hypothetical protein SOV_2c03890 [Sporomusa ovata DSM 2662]CQR73337.1 hypothetical protein SpAn4DRAFT_2569 [Sporomusa ovata]